MGSFILQFASSHPIIPTAAQETILKTKSVNGREERVTQKTRANGFHSATLRSTKTSERVYDEGI